MPNAPAARITDQVQHTEAKTFRRVGMGLGALVGIGIGAFLVVASGAVEVLSAGTLTPVAALGVYVGAALVVGGTAAATGAAVSNSAADMGKSHKEEDGPILTGVTTIYIGADRQMAAHAGSKVACKRHKHSPPDDVELVAQGSSTVLLGPGHDPAARIGDLGTCKFSIGQGCSSVIIGGKTTTRYKIVDGDDPEKALFNEIGKYGGYAALIGGALIAIPIAAAGGGLLMGLRTGAMLLGKGLAMSQGIAWAVNKIPNEELRDHVNTVVALVLPFVGHDKGPAEETPAGGGDPPAGGGDPPAGGEPPTPANDNELGGGRPPEPANDNEPGGGKPPEPANDNEPGGGTDEVSPSGETAQQIGSHDGGAPGKASPDDSSTSGGTEEAVPEANAESDEPATEEKPAEEQTDPSTNQAAKDQAFRERAAAQTQEVREGLSSRYRNSNLAASEFTPAEGSEMAGGAGDYDPSVSGKKAPSYGPLLDPATGERPNPTEPGTGELADWTHPLDKQGEHAGPRNTDSEIKQMEAFKSDLDSNPNMRGTLDIFSDPNDPCDSCQGAAEKFNDAYNGRAKVRIHTPDGKVFDKGGGPIDPPPDGEGGGGTKPSSGEPEGPGQDDPLMQINSRDGGAPGNAPAEQGGGGASTEETGSETVAGEDNPTVQAGSTPGGHTVETGSGDETGSNEGTTEARKWGVTWFNEKALAFINKPDALLGAPGGLSWFMPGEDAAGLRSVADVARETGMAPGAAEALKTGGRIFGLSFPLDGIQSRLPVAADAGFNADGTAESWANPNWLDGGHTAVRVGEVGDPNGSYLVNPTHEFVTDGGNPMPPGAVLFELGPNGSWMPIRGF